MKKTILIILAISIYSTVLSFAVSMASNINLVTSGQTYQMSYKSYNGSQCIIDYIDKNTKVNLFTGFEDTFSQSCPDKAKIVEITKQEAIDILQKKLNGNLGPSIILKPGY